MRDEKTNKAIRNGHTIRRLAARLLVAVLCGLVFGQAHAARAQEMQLGFDFLTVFPRGEFRDNVRNNGYGASGHFLVRVKQSPLL